MRYNDIKHAVKYFSRYFSFFDFTQFDLDQPLPDLRYIGANSFKSIAEQHLRIARERNLTLRQLALEAANPPGDFVGTVEDVANRITEFFTGRAVDGVILSGDIANLRRFVDTDVPILQDRGLHRTGYQGTTLRENLGLSFPVSLHTRAAAAV